MDIIDQMDMNKEIIFKNNKVNSERQNRNHILNLARAQGCEMEVRQIFDRYDKLLNNCTNPKERKHIAIMGLTELHKLLNCQGALNINGIEILPAQKEIEE